MRQGLKMLLAGLANESFRQLLPISTFFLSRKYCSSSGIDTLHSLDILAVMVSVSETVPKNVVHIEVRKIFSDLMGLECLLVLLLASGTMVTKSVKKAYSVETTLCYCQYYQWVKQKILFHCDYQVAMDIGHRCPTRDSETMALVHFLHFCATRYDINVAITHRPGNDSCIDRCNARSHLCIANPFVSTSPR